jgi:hypothetical protein
MIWSGITSLRRGNAVAARLAAYTIPPDGGDPPYYGP